ncbi:MAG: UDP-N-acetylmuramate dehydrogenase [Acidimicrobiia bacterium]|nr:UDP-N-acetylmuramate dehydrogenase [Acidimicrobiia bacterium]
MTQRPRPENDRVETAARLLGARARRNRPLGPLTTYRVGGAAALHTEIDSEDDLHAVVAAVADTRVPVLLVGRGSNLLVADAGFNGLAVTLGGVFAQLELAATRVRAGGAVSLPVVARRTAAAGLTGFEWAVGVPGSVGGAVRMNAGGHGSDVSETLVGARIVDLVTGHDREVPREQLAFGYRTSAVRPCDVVLHGTLDLQRGDRAASEAQIADIVRWRRENQPGGANAGSVFTNPPADSAGRLIDASGLKGHRVGSAHVSPKHANFFQADEGGSADDVLALIEEVQRLVQERMGVRLEPELRLVGFDEQGLGS